MATGKQRAWVEAAARHTGGECLPWPYQRYANGYGRFNTRAITTTAHRIVCAAAHGPAPEKHQAAHACNNRLCCNPRHLRWATCRENLSDRAAHGTLLKGDKHHRTKYSDAVISQLHEKFYTATEQWAGEFKMPPQTVRRILRGATRKQEN